MCFRKAADVVPLLQGLTKLQIASHSRFATKMDFHTSHLGLCAGVDRVEHCTKQSVAIPQTRPTAVLCDRG